MPFNSLKPKPTPWKPKPSKNPTQHPNHHSKPAAPWRPTKPNPRPTSKPSNNNRPAKPSTSSKPSLAPSKEDFDIDTRPIMHTTYTAEKDNQNDGEIIKDENSNDNSAPNNIAPSLPPLPSNVPYSPSSSSLSSSSHGSSSNSKPWCMPGQDRFTFDCQWRPSNGKPPTVPSSLNEVNYQGSEIANNVDMTWLGQIDHFEGVVDTGPETKPQLNIPDVPDMSLMPIIPSTSKHGKCTHICVRSF